MGPVLLGLAAVAWPAAAQVVVLPVPRSALPVAPVLRPLAPALPSLALPALPAAGPSLLPTLPATPSLSAAPAAASAARPAAPPPGRDPVDALVARDGASEDFYGGVRGLVAGLPAEVVRTALRLGYRVQVKDHVTQGRPDLQAVDDKGGGLHDWGEKGNFIIVAERVLVDLPDEDGVFRRRAEWQDSRYWQNAVVHELGHVLDRAYGLAADPAVSSAMDADFADIPAAFKGANLPDGRVNKLYYFLQQEGGRLSRLAREELCAEAFDVLLRGEASSYNHRTFNDRFPRTLAALRSALEARLGPLGRP